VTTRLLVKTLNDVVVVPDAAVQRGPSGLYVYVVTAQSRAQLRQVKVGRIEGGLALVERGLAAGERIVTSGHYRVQPGGPVQVLDEQEPVAATKPVADKVD
jgi:membrane fusion protein, multidrug efflux system